MIFKIISRTKDDDNIRVKLFKVQKKSMQYVLFAI